MTLWVEKYFPSVTLASMMCMPYLLSMQTLPKIIIPMLLLVWLAALVIQHQIKVPKNALILFGALCASQFLLISIGDVKAVSNTLMGLLWVFVALLIWSCMPLVKQHAKIYYLSFLTIGLAWLVVTAIVWLDWTGGEAIHLGMFAMTQMPQPKPAGPFTNGNVFGILMVCAWLISTYFWIKTNGTKYTHLIIATFILVWVFVSMARGAWLAWAFPTLFILSWLIQKKLWWQLVLFILSIILAWISMEYIISNNAIFVGREMSTVKLLAGGARLVLYPAVFEVWKEHWLFGVGLGNLGGHYLTGQAAALSYLPEGLSSLGFTLSAHDHLLHTLAESGIIGLLLWLMVSYTLLRNLWICGLNITSKAWLPLNIALVLWLQGFFNISMTEPVPFFFFFFFFGLGSSFLSEKQFTRHVNIPSKLFVLSSIFVVLFLFVQSIKVTTNWTLYFDMLTASDGPQRGKMVSELLKYESTYPILIQQIASDMINSKNREKQLVILQPHMINALAIEQWPDLYQALFYTYVVQEDWKKACELGIFLKQQRWKNDKNIVAYDKACKQEKVDNFELGW